MFRWKSGSSSLGFWGRSIPIRASTLNPISFSSCVASIRWVSLAPLRTIQPVTASVNGLTGLCTICCRFCPPGERGTGHLVCLRCCSAITSLPIRPLEQQTPYYLMFGRSLDCLWIFCLTGCRSQWPEESSIGWMSIRPGSK